MHFSETSEVKPWRNLTLKNHNWGHSVWNFLMLIKKMFFCLPSVIYDQGDISCSVCTYWSPTTYDTILYVSWRYNSSTARHNFTTTSKIDQWEHVFNTSWPITAHMVPNSWALLNISTAVKAKWFRRLIARDGNRNGNVDRKRYQDGRPVSKHQPH